MQRTQPRYHGQFATPMPLWRGGHQPGHCGRCGEHSAACCCGCRECRKEAKELLVTPQTDKQGVSTIGNLVGTALGANEQAAAPRTGAQATGFIGGGCCVSLSVEYAPETPTSAFTVEILVRDSDGTVMLWGRTEAAGAGYQIKESVITTRPGAKLLLLAANCTARVRWCEVFSCC